MNMPLEVRRKCSLLILHTLHVLGLCCATAMPYHSPHLWSKEKPPTNNALYGYLSRDFIPLPIQDPNSKTKLVQKPKPDLTYVGAYVRREKTRLPSVTSSSLPGGGMHRSQTWAPGQKGGFVPFEKQQEDRYKKVIEKQKTDLLRQLEKATGKKQMLEPMFSSQEALLSPTLPPAPRHQRRAKSLRDTYLWHINAGYLVHVDH